jgi:hypothetical protein
MSYETEHPKWRAPRDLDQAKLASAGFEDISYRNDSFPYFANYSTGHSIAVDYPWGEGHTRFTWGDDKESYRTYHLWKRELCEGETEHECLPAEDSSHVLSTNSFAEVMKEVGK